MLQGSIATFDLLLKTVEIDIDELYPPTMSERGEIMDDKFYTAFYFTLHVRAFALHVL